MDTREFGVLVGDGQVVTSQGKCSGVTLAIRVEIIKDFLLFELGSTDIVLGYTWMATLGETRINWGLQTLKFKVLTHWVTLVGDPCLTNPQVSLNNMDKMIKGGEVVCMLDLTVLFESVGRKTGTPVNTK